ncbi:MAG: deoxyribodipyrimidine photolyase [Acidobacteriota bacterium]
MEASKVPTLRVRQVNREVVNGAGDYVLYWMIANRRTDWNFALDRAVEWAASLGKPLLILEALRCDYRWASDRFHGFVIAGMEDNRRALEAGPVAYYPYVEPTVGAGRGLLAALAERAAVVVTDEFPCFFLPRMVAAAGEGLSVRLEAVDSNGLLPLTATDRLFSRAVDFRRFLQKTLTPHLLERPRSDPWSTYEAPPWSGPLPAAVTDRWPVAEPASLDLASLPIDHRVTVVASEPGGPRAAEGALESFMARRFARYVDGRLEVRDRATSELSAYLHFGHLSSHRVFAALCGHEDWNVDRLAEKATGSRNGWWGMSPPAEAYLDQLVTWRELGYNSTRLRPDYDTYEALPPWARTTLEEHRQDPRPTLYSDEELESSQTHDSLWNAAQNELVTTGRIHNYLRMLWGKKIFEWSETPRQALERMVELNNKYALDGRNPNSYSGIFWCLGLFDRAWGPERPIFGKIRYMTSDSTRRKLDAKAYEARFGSREGWLDFA